MQHFSELEQTEAYLHRLVHHKKLELTCNLSAQFIATHTRNFSHLSPGHRIAYPSFVESKPSRRSGIFLQMMSSYPLCKLYPVW